MDSECPRIGCISRGWMAGPDFAFVLQLSRDGRAGHDIHWGDGGGGVFIVARKAFRVAVDAVDPDGQRAFAVHREHRGLDDRGAGPTAMVDLWSAADGARCFATRGSGQRVVHVDWIHGDVYGAGECVAVSGLPRDRRGAWAGGRRSAESRASLDPGGLRLRRTTWEQSGSAS